MLVEFLFQENIELSKDQVEGISDVLQSLGISSDWLVLTEDNKKFSIEIPPEAIIAAQKFFELGKTAGNWYYDAHKVLSSSFSSEQDMVLFVLILASTSVQNEILTNFLEAVITYKRIKQDLTQQPELFKKVVQDIASKQISLEQAEQTYQGTLSFFGPGITSKPSKYGNIIRVLKLLFDSGKLTKDQAKNAILAGMGQTTEPIEPEDLFSTSKPFIGKLKIANYSLCLLDPEFASSDKNPFNVVIDTWMFRVFYPQFFKKGQPKQISNQIMRKLFGSTKHYNSVAFAVSALAKQAGVSPHVMQAAIWTGIKQEWEGNTGSSTNYVSAIEETIAKYKDSFDGMVEEASKLGSIINSITPEQGVKMLKDRRRENFAKVSSTTSDKKRQFLAMRRKQGLIKPVATSSKLV